MPHRPNLDPEETQRLLDHLDPSVFDRMLRDLIQQWTPDGLADVARKYPDRYLQAVVQAASLRGYTSNTVAVRIDAKVRHVHELSDSELLTRLQELRQLALPPGDVVDADVLGPDR